MSAALLADEPSTDPGTPPIADVPLLLAAILDELRAARQELSTMNALLADVTGEVRKSLPFRFRR